MVMGPVTLVADRDTKEQHGNNYVMTRASLETRDQAAQTDIHYDAIQVKRAEQIIEALSITVQYLAYEVRFIFLSSFFSWNLNIFVNFQSSHVCFARSWTLFLLQS